MTTYREILRAVDSDLDEDTPQSTLDEVLGVVEADGDLRLYLKGKSSHSNDVAPDSGYDVYASLVAVLVTAKVVWGNFAFADKVLDVVLDHNAKLVLAEKVVQRLKQAGMEYSAEKVQSWIDRILDKLTSPK